MPEADSKANALTYLVTPKFKLSPDFGGPRRSSGRYHCRDRRAVDPNGPRGLDGFMPYALERGDIAGGVVVVVKDGRVLLAKGYGYADVSTQLSVDAETTLFRAGSISTLFTWTAVLQLVDRGKLDLDADINGYLDFRIPPYEGRPITVRNLMTHTPGFEESLRYSFATDPGGLLPLEYAVKRSAPMRIFPPGEIPAYSNYGAELTGYIVARVSGEPFEDYVERNIFAPLAMGHSSFRQPLPPALEPGMALGYGLASEPPKPCELIAGRPARCRRPASTWRIS
jgi:CubicO group peptidase (beta-lactamase class C family)